MSAPPEIPGYRVLSLLGRGGMGEVYRAVQEDLGREVALKVLRTGADDPGLRRRLQREARAMAALSHPALVKVYAFEAHGERPFLAMELVRGGTLASRIGKGQTLSIEQVCAIARVLGRGLEAIHGAGLVHRDIKPSNVLIAEEGRIVLADLGVVRARGEDWTQLTADGGVIGTLAYLAPETFLTREQAPPTDLFALGVTLYEALAGVHPNGGAPMNAAFVPPDPRTGRPDCPAPLAQIAMGLLAPDPAQRLTVSALLEALNHPELPDASLVFKSPVAPPSSRPSKPRTDSSDVSTLDFAPPADAPPDPAAPSRPTPRASHRQLPPPAPPPRRTPALAAAAALAAAVLIAIWRLASHPHPPPPAPSGSAALPAVTSTPPTPDTSPTFTELGISIPIESFPTIDDLPVTTWVERSGAGWLATGPSPDGGPFDDAATLERARAAGLHVIRQFDPDEAKRAAWGPRLAAADARTCALPLAPDPRWLVLRLYGGGGAEWGAELPRRWGDWLASQHATAPLLVPFPVGFIGAASLSLGSAAVCVPLDYSTPEVWAKMIAKLQKEGNAPLRPRVVWLTPPSAAEFVDLPVPHLRDEVVERSYVLARAHFPGAAVIVYPDPMLDARTRRSNPVWQRLIQLARTLAGAQLVASSREGDSPATCLRFRAPDGETVAVYISSRPARVSVKPFTDRPAQEIEIGHGPVVLRRT